MDPTIEQKSKAPIDGESHSVHSQLSTGELFSSAKVVADAAQSAYRRETFDKAKAAGAAEDILSAASKYGKLEDKGYAKYVDQAEGYLHKIRGEGGHVEVKPSEDVKPGGGGYGDYMKMAEGLVSKYQSEEENQGKSNDSGKKVEKKEEETSGGEFGNYFKMAEGFLKK
ncbi:nodulin-related protein 1-like [Impatiens glandulifera]|uniref:nodulin-related protein 1-like n=1 Tax=Impatiens glandulifera TaxID=253017 RepID=UPI001FB0C274|nr:nodulin-related protein 1-like [Impatiens glandulifera]